MFRRVLILAFLFICVGAVFAQDFKLFDRDFQVHGFASQGFVYTNENNWLTMNTSVGSGSAQMTDFGANISVPITDKFRAGAQLYDRNLGQLGKWHPELDWAYASYQLKPWFAIRGGKVKTVLGLYTDTQDLDFLHTFALLPQSMYPTDLRDSTIAHTGGDVYGDIRLKNRMGVLSYTAYAGHREDSKYGGYPYLLKQVPGLIDFTSYGGLQYGGDLRWATPLKGLLVGASRLMEDIDGYGTTTAFGPKVPYHEWSKSDWTNQYYAQYVHDRLQIDSEYRRYWRDQEIYSGLARVQTDVRGWYFAGAYRVTKRLQLGSYYSHYELNVPPFLFQPTLLKAHTYDKVVTGLIDLNRFMNLKVEGHFMAGYGSPPYYPEGFYPSVNPQGLKPATNALILKCGFNF
jgi:hypothetical protein